MYVVNFVKAGSELFARGFPASAVSLSVFAAFDVRCIAKQIDYHKQLAV